MNRSSRQLPLAIPIRIEGLGNAIMDQDRAMRQVRAHRFDRVCLHGETGSRNPRH
jgi:hypothetical protein